MTEKVWEWRDDAACVGVDQRKFFPKRGESIAEAREICYSCPVRIDCLEDAIIRREPAGVRGGYSAQARRAMIKRYQNQGIPIPKAESYRIDQ